MTTKHLRKRDRLWAKRMVIIFNDGWQGRHVSSHTSARDITAENAKCWIDGEDAFQIAANKGFNLLTGKHQNRPR
jgi:hypothetical protein